MKMTSEARDSTGSRMEQIMGAASPFGCEMGTVLYMNLEKCGEVTSGTTMKGATNFSMYSAEGVEGCKSKEALSEISNTFCHPHN